MENQGVSRQRLAPFPLTGTARGNSPHATGNLRGWIPGEAIRPPSSAKFGYRPPYEAIPSPPVKAPPVRQGKNFFHPSPICHFRCARLKTETSTTGGPQMGDGAAERVLLVLLATCVLFFMIVLLVRGC